MSTNNKQVTLYVYYQGTPETRFDRDYYTNHHLPLCMEAWQQYGLLSTVMADVARYTDATPMRVRGAPLSL